MNNEKNKRIRIGETKVNTVEVEELDITVENLKDLKSDGGDISDDYYDEEGNFMWDAYEASCPPPSKPKNQIHILKP